MKYGLWIASFCDINRSGTAWRKEIDTIFDKKNSTTQNTSITSCRPETPLSSWIKEVRTLLTTSPVAPQKSCHKSLHDSILVRRNVTHRHQKWWAGSQKNMNAGVVQKDVHLLHDNWLRYDRACLYWNRLGQVSPTMSSHHSLSTSHEDVIPFPVKTANFMAGNE